MHHAQVLSREFREDVIRVARNRGPEVHLKTIAAGSGILVSCLDNWLRSADVEHGIKVGSTAADHGELRASKRRIRLIGGRFPAEQPNVINVMVGYI